MPAEMISQYIITVIIISLLINIYETYKVYMTYFDDFVEALICHHPDVRLLVVAAQQEHFHSDSEKFLELWRRPD